MTWPEKKVFSKFKINEVNFEEHRDRQKYTSAPEDGPNDDGACDS